MPEHEFKITLTLTADELRGILVSAVEGGSGYWAAFCQYDPDAGTVWVCEHNDRRDKREWGPWQEVTLDTLRLGVERCAAAEVGGAWFGEFMRDRVGDGDVADAFLQFAVLGELKYG